MGNQTAVGEDNVLKVLGSKSKDKTDYVKHLSLAIVRVFSKYKLVRLRCIGAAAINNAEKAFILASDILDKEGIDLVQKSHFFSTQFDDSEKTGIMKEVFAR